jgi:hypothetical protein
VPTLHIAIDESGNFRFDKHGTKFLILTAAFTYDPLPLAASLSDLRFSLLKKGFDLACFHCSEDKQPNRNAVVSRLSSAVGWSFASAVLQKNKANPNIRAIETIYPLLARTLIRFILGYRLKPETTQIVICMDRLLKPKAHREALVKVIKQECAAHQPKIPAWVYDHPSPSNKWIQVADYCAWGVMKKWEHGHLQTYDQLKNRMTAKELDVFRNGTKTYY